MERSELFTIVCDCCGARIEVDPRTRRVFSIDKKGMKKRSFEEVVKDVTTVPDRAADKFSKGMEKERNREQHLDEVFEKAQEKARKDPRKRPPSIFDFD